MERVIERMMEAEFIEFLTANLNRPLQDIEADKHLIDEVMYTHNIKFMGLTLYTRRLAFKTKQ